MSQVTKLLDKIHGEGYACSLTRERADVWRAQAWTVADEPVYVTEHKRAIRALYDLGAQLKLWSPIPATGYIAKLQPKVELTDCVIDGVRVRGGKESNVTRGGLADVQREHGIIMRAQADLKLSLDRIERKFAKIGDAANGHNI